MTIYLRTIYTRLNALGCSNVLGKNITSLHGLVQSGANSMKFLPIIDVSINFYKTELKLFI